MLAIKGVDGRLGSGPGKGDIHDELRQIAFARTDQFVEVQGEETVLAEAPPWDEFGGAVQQIKQGAHGVEVKFYDKQWALGKLLDMHKEREQTAASAAGIRQVLGRLRKEVRADKRDGKGVE